jgi:hypothetical protein
MSSSQNQPNTLEARLKLIEDRQAIHDALVRYCRGVDRNDPQLILAAFHDDAVDNHFGPVLPFREAIGTLKGARPGGPTSKTTSMHNLSNILIEIDGDVARCESYVNVIVRIPQEESGGAIDWLHAGRYVDRFERRNGEWRIAHRTVVYDRERFDPVVPAPEGLSQARYLDNAVRGKKGHGDFSYEVFKPSDAT